MFTQDKVFSKDNIALETETDMLLKKMEKIQNKRNNYKNIELLENIYESKNVEKTESKPKNIFEGVQDILTSLEKIENKLHENNFREGMGEEGMYEEGMDEEGMDEEGMDEEGMDEEGMGEEGMQTIIQEGARSRKSKSRKSKAKKEAKKEGYEEGYEEEKKGWLKDENEIHNILKKIKKYIKDASEPRKLLYDKIISPLYDKIYKRTNINLSLRQIYLDKNFIIDEFILLIIMCISVYISGNWFFMIFHRENGLPNSDKFEGYIGEIEGMVNRPYGISRFGSQLQPLIFLNFILCDVVKKIYDKFYYFSTGYIQFISNIIIKFVFGPKVWDEINNTVKYTIENKKFTFIIFTILIIRYIKKYNSSMYITYLKYKSYLPNKIGKDIPKIRDLKDLPKPSSGYLNTLIVLHMIFGMPYIMYIISKIIGLKMTFPKELSFWLSQISDYMKLAGIAGSGIGLIIYFIIWLVALIINLGIKFISGIICMIYFYLYSFFGAQLRGGGAFSLEKMFDALNKDDPCDADVSNPVFKLLKIIISYVYDNLTGIIIILFCISSTKRYNSMLFNKKIAALIISANMIIIALVIIISIFVSNSKQINIKDYNYIDVKLT